jgi:hypothetical protein
MLSVAPKRHITHGLRSGAVKPRLRGYGGLGHYATLHSHARLRPHFCAAGNLRFPSSQRKNAANLSVMRHSLRPDLRDLEAGCGMRDATKNLSGFRHGGIRAAAS